MSLFVSKVAHQVNVITCPRRVDDLAAKNFDIFAARWLEMDVKAHVLNFKSVEDIDSSTYPNFIKFRNALKQKAVRFHTINLSSDVKVRLFSDGMSQAFGVVADVEELYESLGLKSTKKGGLDTVLVNILLDVATAALVDLTSLEVTKEAAFIKKEASASQTSAISQFSVTGSSFKGSVRVIMGEQFLKELYAVLFKMPQASDGIADEMQALLSDFADTVMDKANDRLRAANESVECVFPSMWVGDLSTIGLLSNEVCMVLPFSTKIGRFHLEPTIQK